MGELDNPIDDAFNYGITLLAAHNSLETTNETEKLNSLQSCALLLGGSQKASYEVNQLLNKIKDNSPSAVRISDDNNSLYDFFDMNCDVKSLSEIRDSTKGLESGSDVKRVLNYINESLSHTANTRRQNISIRDFLKNDSHINFNLIEKAADTILREKTTKIAERAVALNEAGIDINSIDLLSEDVKKMLSESLQTEKERVIDINTFTPYSRTLDQSATINKEIKRNIKSAIKMSDDLEFTRARIENDLLRAYTLGESSKEDINAIITDWIDLRILDLKSKPEFKRLNDSEFKNIMIEGLKENVVEEIGLTKFTDNARSYNQLFPVNERNLHGYANDIANKNNLNHIMKNAVGYDRIIERLQAPENSSELAHENLAEKLLGEYYIDKRKDYKASKEMLEVLNQNYNSHAFYDQNKRIGGDLNKQMGKFATNSHSKDGFSDFDGLAKRSRQNVELFPEDMHKLIDLGNSTNLAIQGDTQGIAESLLRASEEGKNWPDRFSKFDKRRTPKEWVEEKLENILNELFSARERIEKNVEVHSGIGGSKGKKMVLDRIMTRNELKAFDKELIKNLNKDEMIMRLLYELDKEYAEMNQLRSDSKFKEQSELNRNIQENKYP